jgi:hypothetical protein
MKSKKKLVVLLAGFFILVNTLSFISSANIGISPASIKFNNVMRGGFAERYVVISVDSEKPIEISLSPRGDVAEWLNFSERSFVVSKDEPYYLRVSANPGLDVPNGNYSGFLRVMTTSFGDSIEEHAVSKIKSSLDLYVVITVTDVELRDCIVKNVRINSAEEGDDVVLSMDILNKGNIRLTPKVFVDVWDQVQSGILQSDEFLGEFLLPTLEKSFEFRIDSRRLDLGQYWSDISVADCLQDFLLTFDILEEGAMKSHGIFLNILSKKEIRKGETILLEANFKNVGEKEAVARFKGEASYGGRVVQVIETEELNVGVGDVEGFPFYFTPDKSGKYIISGRIYYDGKRTYEKSIILDVYGEGIDLDIRFLGSMFLSIFVAVMFFIVRKQKRDYRRRMKILR